MFYKNVLLLITYFTLCFFFIICSDEGKLSTENASHEEGDSHQSCIKLVVDNVLSKDHFNSRTPIASQPDIQNSGSSAMHFVDHCYAETSKVSQPDIQNSDSSAMPFVDHCYGETSKVSQSSAMHVVDHIIIILFHLLIL